MVDVKAVERHLPRQRDGPHDDGHDSHNGEAEVAARAAVDEAEVEHGVADEQRADDRACAFERRVERTRGAVEPGGVDCALVRVEVVGREEHGGERCHAKRSREYVHVIRVGDNDLMGSTSMGYSAWTANSPSMRQSLKSLRRPTASSCGLEAASSLTIVPSARMTLFGGRTKNEDAMPTKMITKNACDHMHHVSPGSTRGDRLLESGEFRPKSRKGRVATRI